MKNNEKFCVYRWIWQKEVKNKITFLKMMSSFFGQHPLVEMSPPATDILYILVYIYQWRLVIFQPRDAVQKSTLYFLKFYLNLRSFFANFIEFRRHHFGYISNLILDYLKIYFKTPAPNGYWCFVWVRVGIKKNLVTWSSQSLKSTIFHNKSAYPIRKS